MWRITSGRETRSCSDWITTLYNATGKRDNFKKDLRDEVPQGGGPWTLVFRKVAPCSLLDIDIPRNAGILLPSRTLSRPRRLHLRQHFPWDIRPTLSKQQIALTDQRQSRPNFHSSPRNSPSPFILYRLTSRDVHFYISYHCYINSFKESHRCYFPNIYTRLD